MPKILRALSLNGLRLVIVLAVFAFGVANLRTRQVSGQTPTPCPCPTPSPTPSPISAMPETKPSATPDEEVAKKAFLAAYTVLLHPRCVNCHSAGNVPTQGDESTAHKGEKLQRGPDGRGVAPFKCTLCHKAANKDTGPILAPGVPDWRMPSQAMPMVFAKRTAAELCVQLKDLTQTGGRTPAMIVEHVKKDALVTWGWNPGLKRTKPPLSHEDFVKQMEGWANNGAACPQ